MCRNIRLRSYQVYEMANKTVVAACVDGIPMPIVKLNRWILVTGIALGLVLQQPLFTTALFLILLPAALFGQRGSVIFQAGRRVLSRRIVGAEVEDRRLMRFNNTIATLLLGLAQAAFLLGAPAAGWALSLMVAVAASVALAGFCVGCFLYYQFKLQRFRLFGN
jgi:hypothetical protein